MGKAILVVDDAIFSRKRTVDTLIKAGYSEIFEAATAKEAKEIFLSNDISLAILDIILPDCEDLALCQELLLFKKDLKVIIYSAVTQGLVIEDAKKMGVEAYYTKPMDEDDFLKTVHDYLQ